MTATTVLTRTDQPTTPPLTATRPRYNASIGYLRAFLTLLVVAHHAALAYHPFAPPPPASLIDQTRIWTAFPVVDPERWSGFAWLVGFNDMFFMALMFFISGLFVWTSLERKGAARSFLGDRALRLACLSWWRLR
jgi:peptidoglycan/LPS O-acetylase OafA/YrhL